MGLLDIGLDSDRLLRGPPWGLELNLAWTKEESFQRPYMREEPKSVRER